MVQVVYMRRKYSLFIDIVNQLYFLASKNHVEKVAPNEK